MKVDPMTSKWHASIIADCERTLGRSLMAEEERFITSRGAFVALEMIHDHVKGLVSDPSGLARYLKSESQQE